MKKIVIAALMLGILSSPIKANETEEVSIIEKDIFGIEYKEENIQTRLNRIERHLYGRTNKGSNQERIKKISETSGISTAPEMTEEEKRVAEADYAKEDNTVNYPVIDLMEEKVFNKRYEGENVYKRVERLEEKAFGKSRTGELSERTDKLKAEILAVKQDNGEKSNYQKYTNNIVELPGSGNIINEGQTNGRGNKYYYEQDNSSLPPFSMNNGYSTGGAANTGYEYSENDFNYALSAAESMIFGKNYTNKTEGERLSKLENKIFKKTFTGDKIERLERVVSAATAKQSGNVYRENKFDRYLSTGMQIGAVLLMILAMIL